MTPTFTYTKDHAKLLSGVGILLMIFHHFFGVPHFFKEGIFYLSIFDGTAYPQSINFESLFAGFCKICVSIYAFNTGYAMWGNQKSFTYSKIPLRLLKFLLAYWMISVLFLIYGAAIGDVLPTPTMFLYNMFGFKGHYFDYVSNRHSWYVYFYSMILLLSPMIILLFKQTKRLIVDIIISLVIILLLIKLYPAIPPGPNTYIIRTLVRGLMWYLSSVLVGVLVCKYDIFNVIHQKLGRQPWFVYVLALLAIVAFRMLVLLPMPYVLNVDALLVIVLIYSVVCLLETVKSQRAEKILLFFGTYSLNIWFIHAIFHTGQVDFLQRVLYLPQYPIFIYFWGILLVVPFAIIVTRMQNAMFKLLFRGK